MMNTLLLALTLLAQDADALKSEIEGIRAENPPWRGISWKPCLLEGLAASRAEKKPLLLWVFIDRPADDARC